MLLARRSPLGILIAAFVYGLAEAFSNYAQGIINISGELILAAPYLITLLAITGASIATTRKAHAGKGQLPAKH